MTVELADTSAWTTHHRDPAVSAAFALALEGRRIAVCSPVRHELFQSVRDAVELADIRAHLDEMPHLPLTEHEWRRSEDVLGALASRGPLHHRQVPFVDLLVAAAAERAEVPVLHYDRHFELIASITGQPVRAIAPLGSL